MVAHRSGSNKRQRNRQGQSTTRGPSADVNFAPIIAGVANIRIQELPPQLATSHHDSVDADIETIVTGLSKVRLQELLEKGKGRAIESPFLSRAKTMPHIHQQTTSRGMDQGTVQPPQTVATAVQQPRTAHSSSTQGIFRLIEEFGRHLGLWADTLEGLVDNTFLAAIDRLRRHIDEDEMYYLTAKTGLLCEVAVQRLELSIMWLDLTLTRNWLERKKEAYLKAGSNRADIRKQMWALVADQARGIKHTRRHDEMMELMFGAGPRNAGASEWEPSSEYTRSDLLLKRIEAMKQAGLNVQTPGTDAGLQQDQTRARLEAKMRGTVVESIRRGRLEDQKVCAYFAALRLLPHLELARVHVKTTRIAPTGLSGLFKGMNTWLCMADMMETSSATVEAYLAETESLATTASKDH